MTDAQTAPVKYASANGAWPANLPAITNEEAIELVRRLYRKFMGRSFRGEFKIASGNRNTTPRRGVYYVNPNRVYNWAVTTRAGETSFTTSATTCIGESFPFSNRSGIGIDPIVWYLDFRI